MNLQVLQILPGRCTPVSHQPAAGRSSTAAKPANRGGRDVHGKADTDQTNNLGESIS
jgi:hypothetical protein